MNIRHDVTGSRFVLLLEDGNEGGHIVYDVEADGHLSAVSVYVSPDLQGKGAAGALLDALVKHAKKHGLKISPICPYVIKQFEANPEKYAEVAKQSLKLADGGKGGE